MKKLVSYLFLILVCFTVAGCGENKDSMEKNEQKVSYNMGDILELKTFDVELVNYSHQKALSEKEKYQNLIFLEVNITNKSSKEAKFSSSLYVVYGPNDTKVATVNTSSYTTSIVNLPSTRPGGKTNGHIIFPYVGAGRYYIVFSNGNSKVDNPQLILDLTN
ncbi:MAG: hypothetical protein Q4G04_04780 [bacterium]|nr:hypothetical protein [bacterium]